MDREPPTWKLADAKARLSEVVRCACDSGSQAITVIWRRAVVVLDAAAYDRLTAAKPEPGLVAFLESLHIDGSDLSRERDPVFNPCNDDPRASPLTGTTFLRPPGRRRRAS